MDYLKEFEKTFNELCRKRSKGQAFSDFVEMVACSQHQVPYHLRLVPKDEDYDRVEQQYMTTIKRYDKDEVDAIVKLNHIASAALEEQQEDFLGPAYMALEISNDKTGQFFTPSPVSKAMALMTLQGAGEVIKDKGYLTLSEPAAGSGGMVIEAANVIRGQGFDPRRTMWFQATDIDRTCFNMAYFQLSSLGLTGEVIHGNTLSMQAWEQRPTAQWRISQALRPNREHDHVPDARKMVPTMEPTLAPTQEPTKLKGRQYVMDL